VSPRAYNASGCRVTLALARGLVDVAATASDWRYRGTVPLVGFKLDRYPSHSMSQQLLFLEFNEINLESVRHYADRGLLPSLHGLIENNGWATTTSEQRYEDVEPWIQWVTAHSGKTLEEHRVFRLGDIVQHELPQIWEFLEAHGLRVGALGPMNAANRLRDPAFFVPDFWTQTGMCAPRVVTRLHAAVSQLVSDNAAVRLTPGSTAALLMGLALYAAPRNYATYASLVTTSGSRPWRRAILLDLLLNDVFVSLVGGTSPDFATLFLNAGAHIQHHYLFSAQCYLGANRNPEWYVAADVDPVLEVYQAYDRILGTIRTKFPAARVMIATGLHQDPHGEGTYYWRLRQHAHFLERVRIPFVRVEPRMSRDFLVVCRDAKEAAQVQSRLAGAVANKDGLPLFQVDNRGVDLFVTLTYPREISAGFEFTVGDETFSGLDQDVVFVALKNGQHNGTGYFLDSGADFRAHKVSFALREMPRIVANAVGVEGPMDTLATQPRSSAA